MIVRQIREGEYKRCQELSAMAFEYAMKDADKTPEEMLFAVCAHPSSRQDIFWHSQWAAFADDDTTMLSTLTVIPYRAAFDGNDVPMTGVGGTWCLLERGENLREAIERLDRKWQSRYNCMVRCEDIEYAWIGRANPFADRSYTMSISARTASRLPI